MRPANEELTTGLAALRDVLEDLLTSRGRGGRAGWEPGVREGILLLQESGDRIEKHDADAVSTIGRVLELLTGALGPGAGVDPLVEPGLTLEEGLAFAKRLRELALDWVQHLPARVDDQAKAPIASRGWKASCGVPQVHHGIAIPAPDVPAADPGSDTASEVAGALARIEIGPGAIRHFVGDGGPDDREEEEEEKDVPPPPSLDRGSPLELAHLRTVARTCLEDVAALGNLRRSRVEDAWVDAEPFEARLLANLDALVSLEQPRLEHAPRIGLMHALWSYATQWSVPDLGRAFAFAFCLACSGESAAIRWALLGLRRASPRVHEAYEDALALGSNSAIDHELMEALRSEGHPGVTATLLRASARRRVFHAPAVLPLLAHPDPEVVCAAIGCAARGEGELVVPALVELLDGEASAAVAAADVLASLGEARGIKHLREIVARASTSPGAVAEDLALAAGTSLAVLGDLRDGPALRALAGRLPELLPALGNHGDPANLAALLDALDGPLPHTLERSIGRALHRMLGAHPEGWRRSTTTGGERRDAWRRVVETTPLEAKARVRRGLTAPTGKAAIRDLVTDLLHPETVQGERPRLLGELHVALRARVGVDLRGWGDGQRVALLALP